MSVDWTTIEPATPFRLRRGKFSLPAKTVATEWLGASEVVAQWDFAASKNFIINTVPTKPTSATYVLCIRYRVDDTVVRYRLWDDANLVLQADKYAGQIIQKNFSIEAWSVAGSTDITIEAQELISGIAIIPTDLRVTDNYNESAGSEATPVKVGDIVSDYDDPGLVGLSQLISHYRADDVVGGSDWTCKVSGQVITLSALVGESIGSNGPARFKMLDLFANPGGSLVFGLPIATIYLVVRATGTSSAAFFSLNSSIPTQKLLLQKLAAGTLRIDWDSEYDVLNYGDDDQWLVIECRKLYPISGDTEYQFNIYKPDGTLLDSYSNTVAFVAVDNVGVYFDSLELTNFQIAEIFAFNTLGPSDPNRELLFTYFKTVYNDVRFAVPLVGIGTAGENNT